MHLLAVQYASPGISPNPPGDTTQRGLALLLQAVYTISIRHLLPFVNRSTFLQYKKIGLPLLAAAWPVTFQFPIAY